MWPEQSKQGAEREEAGSEGAEGVAYPRLCRFPGCGVEGVGRWGWGRVSSLLFNLSVKGKPGSREETWSNLSFKKIFRPRR